MATRTEATELIKEIEKSTNVTLSIKDRHWIQDNFVKRTLYFDPEQPCMNINELKKWSFIIIQNGKMKKNHKVDLSKYSILVDFAGQCWIYLPE